MTELRLQSKEEKASDTESLKSQTRLRYHFFVMISLKFNNFYYTVRFNVALFCSGGRRPPTVILFSGEGEQNNYGAFTT